MLGKYNNPKKVWQGFFASSLFLIVYYGIFAPPLPGGGRLAF
jgi:hypothetical protein